MGFGYGTWLMFMEVGFTSLQKASLPNPAIPRRTLASTIHKPGADRTRIPLGVAAHRDNCPALALGGLPLEATESWPCRGAGHQFREEGAALIALQD
jgi:hypothetical protein